MFIRVHTCSYNIIIVCTVRTWSYMFRCIWKFIDICILHVQTAQIWRWPRQMTPKFPTKKMMEDVIYFTTIHNLHLLLMETKKDKNPALIARLARISLTYEKPYAHGRPKLLLIAGKSGINFLWLIAGMDLQELLHFQITIYNDSLIHWLIEKLGDWLIDWLID